MENGLYKTKKSNKIVSKCLLQNSTKALLSHNKKEEVEGKLVGFNLLRYECKADG